MQINWYRCTLLHTERICYIRCGLVFNWWLKFPTSAFAIVNFNFLFWFRLLIWTVVENRLWALDLKAVRLLRLIVTRWHMWAVIGRELFIEKTHWGGKSFCVMHRFRCAECPKWQRPCWLTIRFNSYWNRMSYWSKNNLR